MCITTAAEIIKINKQDATVKIGKREFSVKMNPQIKVKNGDKVLIFKNFIIDKI